MSWVEDPGVEIFHGLDMTKLDIDEAYVRLTSVQGESWLYSLSTDCIRCPYSRIARFTALNNSIIVKTVYQSLWRVTDADVGETISQKNESHVLCNVTPSLGEFGVYNLTVEDSKCIFTEEKEAVNINLPILILFFILCGVILLWKLAPYIMRRYVTKRPSDSEENLKKKGVERKRIKSLDTFRGLSIVVMIFVNHGGGRYWWIEHATWNGLHIADLVFPFFIWIMGVCIPISVKSIVSNRLPKHTALIQIFRRSCSLFLIGVALGSLNAPIIYDMRIFGVLQRFGICYFVVASLVVILAKERKEAEGKFWKIFKDIKDLWIEWIVMLGFILLHLLITFLVPVPECPTGYIGAGGMQDDWAYKDCIGGVTRHVDLSVLGNNHIYQYPTTDLVYKSGPFDPEGIFGCILSIVQVFFGVQAGYTLLHHVEWKPVVIRWLSWAFITGLVGGILCNFSKEDGFIPINKNMWSLSFVLVTTCFCFIVLSAFYLLIDVFEWWDGSPFIQPGMNAITMYVGHYMCYLIFPFHWRIPDMRTHFVFLLEAIWGTILWIIVAFEMARSKVFITL